MSTGRNQTKNEQSSRHWHKNSYWFRFQHPYNNLLQSLSNWLILHPKYKTTNRGPLITAQLQVFHPLHTPNSTTQKKTSLLSTKSWLLNMYPYKWFITIPTLDIQTSWEVICTPILKTLNLRRFDCMSRAYLGTWVVFHPLPQNKQLYTPNGSYIPYIPWIPSYIKKSPYNGLFIIAL